MKQRGLNICKICLRWTAFDELNINARIESFVNNFSRNMFLIRVQKVTGHILMIAELISDTGTEYIGENGENSGYKIQSREFPLNIRTYTNIYARTCLGLPVNK